MGVAGGGGGGGGSEDEEYTFKGDNSYQIDFASFGKGSTLKGKNLLSLEFTP